MLEKSLVINSYKFSYMKILLQIFMVIALIMAGFNLFQIDWELPFEGKSMVAVIGVVASLSAFLLLLILEGENIPENQKSIAISVTIQSTEKTLNDNDLENINNFIGIFTQKLKSNIGFNGADCNTFIGIIELHSVFF